MNSMRSAIALVACTFGGAVLASMVLVASTTIVLGRYDVVAVTETLESLNIAVCLFGAACGAIVFLARKRHPQPKP